MVALYPNNQTLPRRNDYFDGKEIPEAATETEKVNVNTGFGARLKAFFRALFGKLPKVVQEYLGVEIIDRVLP